MKIRIYETDFEGHPVECTGEFFSGPSAIAIVEAMKMSPFTASLDPLAFMRRVLDGIGQADFELTGPPEKAAIVFLQRLTALNFAGYELEEDEVIFAPVSEPIRETSGKQVKQQGFSDNIS